MKLESRKDVTSKSRVERRQHIGVIFKCCRIYQRLYLNRKADAFVGWCPKCTAKMEVFISPFGSSARFFTAE